MIRNIAVFIFATFVLILAGCHLNGENTSSNEQVDYEKAMSEAGTYDDCRYFINAYPNSKHIGAVTTKAEKIANKSNSKLKTTAPELSDSQINQLTMDLISKFKAKNIDVVIIYPYSMHLKLPKGWIGASIKNQKDIFVDKIGKKIETEFNKFVINQADCEVKDHKNLGKIFDEVSNLLDEKFSQEDAVKKLGHIEVADAFIFFDINVEVIDKKNLEKPFLTGTCHEAEFSYSINAKLVPVASGTSVWVQNLEFKHNTYIWNSTSK